MAGDHETIEIPRRAFWVAEDLAKILWRVEDAIMNTARAIELIDEVMNGLGQSHPVLEHARREMENALTRLRDYHKTLEEDAKEAIAKEIAEAVIMRILAKTKEDVKEREKRLGW